MLSGETPPIRLAAAAEADEIALVINQAFKRAESFFIERDRISAEEVARLLQKGAFLVVEHRARLAGCVYVETRGDRGYFGLLAVRPAEQRRGLARTLIAAAEDYCRAAGCRLLEIRVVNLRAELPPVYRALGYRKTGTAPFTAGISTKMPCHFIVMAKEL